MMQKSRRLLEKLGIWIKKKVATGQSIQLDSLGAVFTRKVMSNFFFGNL